LHGDADGGERDAGHLHPRQPLTEHEESDQHIQQRVQKVTKAAFHDTIVMRGPDEDAPVDGEQEARPEMNA
jgi:hypothetical protein